MTFLERITFGGKASRDDLAILKPFLAPQALFGLTLAPPFLVLLTAQLGSAPSLVHAAGCLVATWLCTVLVGSALHLAIGLSAPRIIQRLGHGWASLAALVCIGAGTIVLGMLALLPELTWVPPADHPVLLLRALGIGGLYVVVARLAAVLLARAKASAAIAAESRAAALQARVSPHFLFNTLNAIASLIPTQPDLAETTIERLAGVLQYSIASGSLRKVPLEAELDTVRDYLGIEQARFGARRLRTWIEVSPELQQHTIPPMLLQPLVENAVLHGLASREEGGGIWITGHEDQRDLILTVSDDGVGPQRSKRRGNRTGLNSVRERLALVYGGAAALAVRSRLGGGFECELRVPRD